MFQSPAIVYLLSVYNYILSIWLLVDGDKITSLFNTIMYTSFTTLNKQVKQ